MSKAFILRQLFSKKPILKIMGAHNALGAKLIEKAGFDGVWASGFEIATANGVPDANILTMTENLQVAQNINASTRLPVICDCDTGYGNAINVMHMIRKYESAGLAAVVIEDKRFPKVNSFIPGRQELASVEEFVGKIKAAQASRLEAEKGILIFARVEALIAGWGMEEALARAAAYHEAGADGIVIHSKSTTPDQVFEFAQRWQKKVKNACPLIAIPTTYYQVTDKELAKAGFKGVIYANHGIRASTKAMTEIFQKICNDGTTRAIENSIASMDELFHLQGMHTYCEEEERFSQEHDQPTVVIPAAGDHRYQPELSPLLQDQPLCMLNLGGKPLLEHQCELYRSIGAGEIKVVVGYKKENICVKEIQLIENSDFQTKKSAHSVMCGLKEVHGKVLIGYSDIIFDRQIPSDLIQSPYPITIVIDRAFRSLPRRDKDLDLVITAESASNTGSRKMQLEKFKKITSIGKKLDPRSADHEFIGMVLLSRQGLESLKSAWSEAQNKFKNKPFYEASSVDTASLTDLLQFMIDSGAEVCGMVIEHGWSEIFSLEDYERVERYFAEKNTGLLFQTS